MTNKRLMIIFICSCSFLLLGCGSGATKTSSVVIDGKKYKCLTPSGGVLGGLRVSVRDVSREPEKPWASVQSGKFTFLAAPLSSPPTSVPQIVVVRSSDSNYAVNMVAVNGTARTFTNLKPGGDMNGPASAALECVNSSQ